MRLEQGELFERDLAGIGPEIVVAEEPERFGRGGGIKFAAQLRREDGDVFALNGDELVAVDFAASSSAIARPGAPARSRSRVRSRRSASSSSTAATS